MATNTKNRTYTITEAELDLLYDAWFYMSGSLEEITDPDMTVKGQQRAIREGAQALAKYDDVVSVVFNRLIDEYWENRKQEAIEADLYNVFK